MKLTETTYRGGAALDLRTRELELRVTTSVGPRIVSLRPAGGRAGNHFLELPADEPRYHGFYLRGGHRLWHAPEDIVRSYQPDDDPVEIRRLAAGVALTAPTEPRTGLQKAVALEAPDERTVKVTHLLTNRNLWSVTCAPWALTMLRGGGYGVLPLPPKGSHAGGDLLPKGALVPWTFTDLSLPVWNLRRDFIGVDVPRAPSAQKLGLTDYPGWSAYWRRGEAFVKYSRPAAGPHPDLGSRFETFTNGAMIELETLGPLAELAPGRSARHVEYWTVLKGLAKPSADRAFRALARRVDAWLARLT
jgi:hypothetical protein